MFRRRFLPLSLLVLAMSGCWEQPKTATWSNATGPENFTRLLWKSIQSKDWVQVESRLASTYVMVNDRGVFDKTQTLDQLKQFDISSYMLGDFDVRPDGSDSVVTYTVALHLRSAGKEPPEARLRCMTVWQQQAKSWVVIAHSEAPIAAQGNP